MGKCEQCIVREFSAIKALNKDELLKIADCKTSYTVKKGETLFTVAQKHGISVKRLIASNNSLKKSKKVNAGTKLAIK